MNNSLIHLELSPDQLRWRCPLDQIPGDTTDDIMPVTGVIGQDTAVEALRFGLAIDAPGQNIFVRGLTGTGRMTLLSRLLQDIRPECPLAQDRCYVANFQQSDRPMLISLPRGQGRGFCRAMNELADFIRDDLKSALDGNPLRARRSALEKQVRKKTEAIIKPFDDDLRKAGLSVVTITEGNAAGHSAIFPLIDGEPMAPEEYEELHRQGKISDEGFENYLKINEHFQERFEEVTAQVHNVQRGFQKSLQTLVETEIRTILYDQIARILNEFSTPPIKTFLQDTMDNLINEHLPDLEQGTDFSRLYRVNLILDHGAGDSCPIIVENTPTVANLLGAIDRELVGRDAMIADHLTIRAGSILRADGGYLVIDARDLLTEPGAWKMLSRTLRTGRLEIVPSETQVPWAIGFTLKPEPIDISVKVVLLGDAETFYMLDTHDHDFPNLFKVLADFDSLLDRDESAVQQYAGVLARIAHEENLPAFNRGAIASLVEHGARIADRAGKITTKFGRLADLAREAAFLANTQSASVVTKDNVDSAIRRTRHRADLPSRRFRQFIVDGTIKVQTSGKAVGQINGLAVLESGPLTYGFPSRITATIGPGTAGVINIERESALSGSIHTKGFYILGGLLRTLLQTDHPLAFSASIAFEQSYGGIDGDSASGAEMCCLLSALTRTPIRQDMAMTGAIDQTGNILAIGAATPKIEGFFDVCNEVGLTGTQGIILPKANARDLMLREDIVEACENNRFHIHTVQHIHDAIEIMTGTPAGRLGEHGEYEPGTLLYQAKLRARKFWEQASRAGAPIIELVPSIGDENVEELTGKDEE